MARTSKDIQLSELKDMISQLNTTIKTLNDTIARQQTENDNLKVNAPWPVPCADRQSMRQ